MRRMKAFLKGNPQREFHQRFRSQSAMEYLMTYGWAILIIAVVLAALFELGVFNPMTFAPKASPGSCQVVRPEGAGTTNFTSLSGECNGELPQYVAQFNGNSYIKINVPKNELPVGNDQFTKILWVYLTPNNYDAQDLLCWGINGTTAEDNTLRTMSSANQFVNYFWADDMSWTSSHAMSGWNFIAITYNGITEAGYVNGFEEVNFNPTTIPDVQYSNVIVGGRGLCGVDNFYVGYISNVQIYNTALSPNDIKALYQEGVGGAPIKIQNLVGWWPLNGNANDYSGNGNNGVPTSGVSYTSNWYSGYSAP